MNECESSRPWRPTSDFLEINRTTQASDFWTKRIVVALSVILVVLCAVLCFVPSLPPIYQRGIFSIMIVLGSIYAGISYNTMPFMIPAKKTEKFLTGIKIYLGVDDRGENIDLYGLGNFGATFVDSGGMADYGIEKKGDEYKVFGDIGARLIFSIRVDDCEHTDVIAATIAMVIYTSRKQRD